MSKRTVVCRLAAMAWVVQAAAGCSGDGEGPGALKDAEGHAYATEAIGSRNWMAENLRATQFNDGTPIARVTDAAEWLRQTSPALCDFENDASRATVYGVLYNGYSVQSGKLCPAGWHVPTDAEWTALLEALGGESEAGGKLKEAGTSRWNAPNAGATNESGFTALPAGGRGEYFAGAGFGGLGTYGYWWSSTPGAADRGWLWFVTHASANAARNGAKLTGGFSVRCIEDL